MEPIFSFGKKSKMNKYEKQNPLLGLIIRNAPFGQVFYDLLSFSLKEGSKILDVTCGRKHSWQYYFMRSKNLGFNLSRHKRFDITFADNQNFGDNIICDSRNLEKIFPKSSFDAIYFDPPYIFDVESHQDSRENDYGGYSNSFLSFQELIKESFNSFQKIITNKELIFFKCSDLFLVKENRFISCIIYLKDLLDSYEIINLSIIQHHHVSGTAWQVKNRSCWIISYSYLYVLRLK